MKMERQHVRIEFITLLLDTSPKSGTLYEKWWRMRKAMGLLLLVVIIGGCSTGLPAEPPAPTWTAVPTYTPYPTYTPSSIVAPEPINTSSPTATARPTRTPTPNAQAYLSQGWSYYEAKQHESSVAAYSVGLGLGLDSNETTLCQLHYGRGLALTELGHTEEAAADFRECLEVCGETGVAYEEDAVRRLAELVSPTPTATAVPFATVAPTVEPSATKAPAPSDSDILKGIVSFTGTQFTITNNDTFDWTNCKLEINGGLIRSGFIYRAELIEQGKGYTIGAMQFAKSDGTRFNPAVVKPLKFFIYCDTPSGKASYLGGWN